MLCVVSCPVLSVFLFLFHFHFYFSLPSSTNIISIKVKNTRIMNVLKHDDDDVHEVKLIH